MRVLSCFVILAVLFAVSYACPGNGHPCAEPQVQQPQDPEEHPQQSLPIEEPESKPEPKEVREAIESLFAVDPQGHENEGERKARAPKLKRYGGKRGGYGGQGYGYGKR